MNLASEDSAVEAGLEHEDSFSEHEARSSIPMATMLWNSVYYGLTGNDHSESRGVVDVQVDFTGLAIYARIATRKTGYAGVPHRSAEH